MAAKAPASAGTASLDGWRELRALSLRMLASARASDWAQVATLQAARDATRPPPIRAETPTGKLTALSGVLRSLKEINDEITALAVASRDTRAEQLRRLRRGRRLPGAYRLHS